jgi:hypothetical protein
MLLGAKHLQRLGVHQKITPCALRPWQHFAAFFLEIRSLRP